MPMSLTYLHRDPLKVVSPSLRISVFVKFPSLKLGVFVLYRPPDAPNEKFQRALNFVQRCIDTSTVRSRFAWLGL